MAKHVLSLEVPDISNDCILRIVDTSLYSELITVNCPTLQIIPPGFDHDVTIDAGTLVGGFTTNITACDLGLQTDSCDAEQWPLPDGIYQIRYSVAPNEYVYVQYNHLRITQAINRYKQLLCNLDLGACEPKTQTQRKLRKLLDVKGYLEAAKAKVEFCEDIDAGMVLYNYALSLMAEMDCKTC